MKKVCLAVFIACVSLGILSSCSSTDDLTKRDIDINVVLDAFNLVGTGGIQSLAVSGGNPSCSTDSVSINELLAQVDNMSEIEDFLDKMKISQVSYRITRNDTPVDITGALQMTDPNTNSIVDIASTTIPALTTVDAWTPLPFTSGGDEIVQHFLDQRSESFSYCAAGTPDDSQISLTIELRLDMVVTVDLF